MHLFLQLRHKPRCFALLLALRIPFPILLILITVTLLVAIPFLDKCPRMRHPRRAERRCNIDASGGEDMSRGGCSGGLGIMCRSHTPSSPFPLKIIIRRLRRSATREGRPLRFFRICVPICVRARVREECVRVPRLVLMRINRIFICGRLKRHRHREILQRGIHRWDGREWRRARILILIL
ncbi:hypothetical protein B0H14DRAFT_2782508 [Mycena olivaceomarginata]|nr:hypothetical protein B0H14DRAFT_2782508 [Mycena olivaceomarginata]